MKSLVLLLALALTAGLAAIPASAVLKEDHSDVVRVSRVMAEAAQRKKSAAALRKSDTLSTDVGNIVVMQDDATLITAANPFNIANRSFLFTPAPNASYTLTTIAAQFDNAAAQAGQKLTLADDDTRLIQLGFAFPYFGQSYSSIFLNSDGNLTFTGGDVAITARDFGRFLGGHPRIAPFFADMNPSQGGTVTANILTDRAIFSWLAVPYCCIETMPAPVAAQTFQVILFPDGRVQFNYGAVQGQSAVVGISPGGGGGVSPTTIDFTQLSASVTATAAVGEVFSNVQTICVTCVAQRFFANHEDAYDEIFIWSDVPYSFSGGGDVFAESNEVRNDATGIGGLDNTFVVFDSSRESGAVNGRLQSIVEMGAPGKYPVDPTARVVGENNSIAILAHEMGHRWLAYTLIGDSTSSQDTALLGRAFAHWSFYFNTLASVLEGNEIQDNGNGTFTTIRTVSQYSPLDRYLMGLIPPEQVPDTFLVTNAVSLYPAAYAPTTGASISGTRTPVTIAGIAQANGPRLPPAAMSPKTFNVAFVLLVPQGSTADPSHIAQLDGYRAPFEAFFSAATGGSGTLHTGLLKSARILPLPFAAGSITTTVPATLVLQSPAAAGGATFQVQSSDATIAKVPATVTVAPGATQAPFSIIMGNAGTATITATSPGYETISGAAASTNGAVVNGATFTAGVAVSPGSIASLFGFQLTPTTQTASALPLPTTLGNASVLVNGTPAPLFYVSPGQINFQVPTATLGSYANLVLMRAGQTVFNLPLLLASTSPGLFASNGRVVVIDAITGAPITSAHAGQIISLFATGLGAVYPSIASGTPAGASPLSLTTNTVSATIGGQPAAVGFAGLAPSFVGLYQLNVTVPSGATGANLPIVVSVNGASSNAPTITVQ